MRNGLSVSINHLPYGTKFLQGAFFCELAIFLCFAGTNFCVLDKSLIILSFSSSTCNGNIYFQTIPR